MCSSTTQSRRSVPNFKFSVLAEVDGLPNDHQTKNVQREEKLFHCVVPYSLVDEGSYRLSAVLDFGFFSGPKRVQTPHSSFWDF